MINALSIDLEDWFHVHNMSQIIRREDWERCELRVVENTRRLLDLLTRYHTRATFFVLGWVAERVPDLIGEIERHGHEIASHGYSHTLLTQMTPESFETDLHKALHITRLIARQDVIGFRAPSFTITNKTLWALDILTRHGIRYDSSVFPIGFHPDYGMATAPLHIYNISPLLIEFPLSCASILGKRIPCSGGGYFRIFPYALTRRLIHYCNKRNHPIVFYLHPWEIDPAQPRKKLPWLKQFRHYYNLDKTFNRLERLLNDFRFTSIREVLSL
jgi:polysaccharide deacetylase family protein (PEP-CTERM system associated)